MTRLKIKHKQGLNQVLQGPTQGRLLPYFWQSYQNAFQGDILCSFKVSNLFWRCSYKLDLLKILCYAIVVSFVLYKITLRQPDGTQQTMSPLVRISVIQSNISPGNLSCIINTRSAFQASALKHGYIKPRKSCGIKIRQTTLDHSSWSIHYSTRESPPTFSTMAPVYHCAI